MSVPLYSMIDVAPTLAAIMDVPAPAQSAGEPMAEILDGLDGGRRCALLAPDALGMHPWSLWKDEMPFFTALVEARHVVLRSVMPTITPVNFATMVTGVEQSVHGIGTYNDKIQCETLFDVLGAQGKQGAAYGQEGCTMGQLIYPIAQAGRRVPRHGDDQIVEALLTDATEVSPDFIITQLVTTDDVFHRFKPSNPEVVPYVRDTDARLKRLVEGLSELEYAVMILADHGQHDGEERGTHGTDADEDSLVPCTWIA